MRHPRILVPAPTSDQVTGTDVQLSIGRATYTVQVSTQDPAWQDPREMTRHLEFNGDVPGTAGVPGMTPARVRR